MTTTTTRARRGTDERRVADVRAYATAMLAEADKEIARLDAIPESSWDHDAEHDQILHSERKAFATVMLTLIR